MRKRAAEIWLFALLAAGQGAPVLAQGVPPGFDPVRAAVADGEAEQVSWSDLVKPWSQFTEPSLLAGLVIAFVLATALSGLIAYHPRSYGKARSLEDVEAPKTYIMYALVGAVCGQVVKIEPSLSLVIFGLGGLMRFRTDVGAAKDTGRVILVTIVGLSCGLLRYDIAIVSTAFAYVLIAALEGGAAYRVVVKGLGGDTLLKAADAYREILDNEGCRILNEKKSFAKFTVRFTFRAPRGTDREDLEQLFEDSIPNELKGSTEWQSS